MQGKEVPVRAQASWRVRETIAMTTEKGTVAYEFPSVKHSRVVPPMNYHGRNEARPMVISPRGNESPWKAKENGRT